MKGVNYRCDIVYMWGMLWFVGLASITVFKSELQDWDIKTVMVIKRDFWSTQGR